MEFVTQIAAYIVPFLVVLSVLVFVHEFGHYIIARWCSVKVEAFSIGFGRELFGRTDRSGTRWKVCLIPLGGYVQMYGDTDPSSSNQNLEKLAALDETQRNKAFYFKKVWQRAAIVIAGPAINFLYAIVVMSGLFMTQGQIYSPSDVGGLVENGPAAKAGFKLADKIIAINGIAVERFQDIQREVAVNLDSEMNFTVLREGQEVSITTKPEIVEQKDNFGFRHQVGRIGIMSVGNTAIKKHAPVSAVKAAVQETWSMSVSTLKALGQMISGTRSADELGGVIRIGAYAKEFSDAGWMSLLMFSALISVNLGLINLFPIPLLDGGHLVFYAYEAIFRKPMPQKIRMAALRVGYIFVITLMLFATFNDLMQLKVFQFLAKLGS